MSPVVAFEVEGGAGAAGAPQGLHAPAPKSLVLPEDTSLECHGNTVQTGQGLVFKRYTQICSERCKDWFCPRCCELQGGRLRQRVINAWPELKHAFMLTFTIDPELFPAGPESAFRHVSETRAISRTLHAVRKFHTGKWFAVVEWQENGWPHWHVVLDAPRIPVKEVERQWGKHAPAGCHMRIGTMGMVRYSKKPFMDAKHALMYATKYVVKVPLHPFPAWVWDYKGRIRRFSTSRGFWGLQSAKPPPERDGEPRKERTHAERVKECCRHSRVLKVQESVDPNTGELIRRKAFIGRVTANVCMLADAVEKFDWDDAGCPKLFWRKGTSLCFPGNWSHMQRNIAQFWELVGHAVHWQDGKAHFASQWDMWREVDRAEKQRQ